MEITLSVMSLMFGLMAMLLQGYLLGPLTKELVARYSYVGLDRPKRPVIKYAFLSFLCWIPVTRMLYEMCYMKEMPPFMESIGAHLGFAAVGMLSVLVAGTLIAAAVDRVTRRSQ